MAVYVLSVVGALFLVGASVLNPGILWIVCLTCAAVIGRVHSNWRGVPAWRGHQRKSLWSNRTRGSFQQLLQACQLITR
jgi:hypothetical protein